MSVIDKNIALFSSRWLIVMKTSVNLAQFTKMI